MRTPTTSCAAAVVTLLLAVSTVRADPISWSYDFSLSSTAVRSDDGVAGNGHINITPFRGTLTANLPSSATITAVNLQAVSSALANAPARFTDAEYTLVMRFKDLSSGLTAAVTFEGELNGTVSARGAALTNTFLGQKEFSINLNHHIYDVSVGNFHAPGAPGSGDLGSVSVNVSLHHNPEPSSLILAAFGVPALGWLRRRRGC